MIGVLLKKQIKESLVGLIRGRGGKRRSAGEALGFSALLLLGLASVYFLFGTMGHTLCGPLAAQGLSWVYFAMMGTMATVLGLIGSVFTTKTKLYEAKDNDLLLSMPIPAWKILFSRMAGLYLFTLLFESLVFVPATVCYFIAVEFSVPVLLYSLLSLLILSLGALALCCILGWVLALIAAKLPGKNVMTVLLTVAFVAVYYIGYSKINTFLIYAITNGGKIAATMQTVLYPFWKLGLACTGSFPALLIFGGIFVGAFALVYLLLSVSYVRLATANRGSRRAVYKSKEGRQSKIFFALVRKELRRFTKNPMVAMNCVLGSIFLVILPFVLLFLSDFRTAMAFSGQDGWVALLTAAVLCVASSMNVLSASSVSLEGDSLWIARSLPVSTERILLSKVATHWLVAAIPATFSLLFLSILLRLNALYALLVLAVCYVFILCAALFGLMMNLKMPNLHWTNEVATVKQSMAAGVSMFAEWGVLGLLIGGYVLFGEYLRSAGYLFFGLALLAGLSALVWLWIKKRGKTIFEEL